MQEMILILDVTSSWNFHDRNPLSMETSCCGVLLPVNHLRRVPK